VGFEVASGTVLSPNIYYAIISSDFSNDFDEAVRSLKRETSVNETTAIDGFAAMAGYIY
jgi:hypothetical protein